MQTLVAFRFLEQLNEAFIDLEVSDIFVFRLGKSSKKKYGNFHKGRGSNPFHTFSSFFFFRKKSGF